MKSYNILVIVALIIGAAQCQINWSKLTEHELNKLPSDVFANITADQFVSIPIHAFRGWRTDQIQKVPAAVFHHILPGQLKAFQVNACEGFTVDQMKLPGDLCNNFNPHRCFSKIPAASFAGFDSHCLSALPTQLIREITPNQFSNLNPNSLIGFSCSQIGYGTIHAAIFPVITPAQLDGFSSDACCFIDHNMHIMKDETLRAMTSSCVENLGYDAFQNITLEQFNLFPTDAIHTITSYNIVYGNASLWAHLTIDQLSQLGQPAWAGFAYIRQFQSLIMKHGKSLVDELTSEQLTDVFAYEPVRASIVKEGIYNHFANSGTGNTYSWNEVREELHYVNWVKILLVNEHEADFSQHFTANVMDQMQGHNMMGIRGVIFGKIDPSSFQIFNGRGLDHLSADQIGNMTAAQWNTIPIQALHDSDLYDSFVFIPVDVIPHINPDHFAALASNYIAYPSQWMCTQIRAITAEQVAAFSDRAKEDYHGAMARCSTAPLTLAPNSVIGPTAIHVPGIAVPPGQQGNNNGGVGVGGVFAIILGCIAGVEALMIGYYFYRKSRAVQYQAL